MGMIVMGFEILPGADGRILQNSEGSSPKRDYNQNLDNGVNQRGRRVPCHGVGGVRFVRPPRYVLHCLYSLKC